MPSLSLHAKPWPMINTSTKLLGYDLVIWKLQFSDFRWCTRRPGSGMKHGKMFLRTWEHKSDPQCSLPSRRKLKISTLKDGEKHCDSQCIHDNVERLYCPVSILRLDITANICPLYDGPGPSIGWLISKIKRQNLTIASNQIKLCDHLYECTRLFNCLTDFLTPLHIYTHLSFSVCVFYRITKTLEASLLLWWVKSDKCHGSIGTKNLKIKVKIRPRLKVKVSAWSC